MTRPLRIQFPGAMYHIMARGNGGQAIFNHKDDYQEFLKILKNVIEDYNWLSYAYCLMPNHYHLFIKTINPNLSLGMQRLNGDYSSGYNARHNRYGHLFQGRYKSILVENESYQGNLMRYIVFNPVRANLVKKPEKWMWSSHNEIIGLAKPCGCLQRAHALSFFHGNIKKAVIIYTEYIYENSEDCYVFLDDLKSGFILGSGEFVKSLMANYGEIKDLEIVKTERFAGRLPLESIITETNNKKKRNEAIMKAFCEYGYTQSDIAVFLGIHFSTISRILKNNNCQTHFS